MRLLYQISKHAVHCSLCLLSVTMLLFACVANTVAKNMQEMHFQLDTPIFPETLPFCRDNLSIDLDRNTQTCDVIQESGIGGTGINSEVNTMAVYSTGLKKFFDGLSNKYIT